MRAMILAAGRGKRMQHLTHHVPKPLLRVGNHYLIEYTLHQLSRANIKEVVINVSYHAELIKKTLGDGKRYGIHIHYSFEPEPLETGGGIFQALPQLGDDPFLVMSADVIHHYPLHKILSAPKGLAHLIMVNNPSYHPQGDFGLRAGKIDLTEKPFFTFGNIGVYRKALFAACVPSVFSLATVLKPAIAAGLVSGEHYQGTWFNVGTPEDLEAINLRVQEDIKLIPLVSETTPLSQ